MDSVISDIPCRIEPLGEWGWLTHWPDEESAAAWAELARDRAWPNLTEIVPAYRSVAVLCDPKLPDDAYLRLRSDVIDSFDAFDASVSLEQIRDVRHVETIDVPVVYDGEDLAEVADRLGLSPEAVVTLHVSQVYRVFAVGFLPGFPYAGYLPERLSGLPRRESPRTKVPAGSVAIAGRQTGIYPCESPGGWHLLGHTPMSICDLDQGFFRFRPTDRIRFVAEPGGVMPLSAPEFASN